MTYESAPWMFVPPKPRSPAEGRINCAAPYNSTEGGLNPHGCNKQNHSALTLCPWGDPRDKVLKHTLLESSGRSAEKVAYLNAPSKSFIRIFCI